MLSDSPPPVKLSLTLNSDNRYTQLLAADLPSEPFVRTGLGALEAGFREMALLALHDWAKLGITSDELFNAVASLQRPSWGMWNGLISALRNARKGVIRSGDAEQRKRLESATILEKVLALADQPVDPGVVSTLKPLGELTRTSIGSKLKLGALLAMPIALRNRIAHDTPTDSDWWTQAAAAMKPLIGYHAAADPMRVRRVETDYPSPWFLIDGGQALAFNGIEHDFAALYVNDAGVSKAAPGREGELLREFAKLLGKADEQEIEFKALLSKLAPDEIRGVMLGDYLVGRPVGEGGFATVHVGRQLSTGRKVAIKILHDGMDPEAITRFHQEAAFLSRFRHPHIVDVYGFGQETWAAPRAFSLVGEPWFDAFAKTAPVKSFIALEWIEGRTLDEIFRESIRSAETKPDLHTLANWMAAAADALSVVHAAGLIHRDIKPHNLMITTSERPHEGQLKLMDFGIARVVKAERTLVTEAGRALGTPAYMSPEQIRSADAEGEVGPASDVYSLAATFYELITGQRLYKHDTVTIEEVKTLKTTGRRPTRPSIVVSGLPWEIETILLGGLEPEPADRYRTMDALERDIRHYLADEPIEYKQPSLSRRLLLVYRRNRAISNLAAGFVVLLAIGITGYIHSINKAERRTAAQRDIAIASEKIAREQKAIADAREKDVRLKLAELSSNNGHALIDKGDPTGALLWYVRSLPLLADAPEQDRVERRRIGITLRQLPRQSRLWNYDNPQLQSVYVAAISPDGTRIATGEVWIDPKGGGFATARGGARILDAATGKTIVPPIEHPKVVSGVSFSRDGKRFVTLADGLARVFDSTTGEAILAPIVDDTGIGLARLNFDGSRLLVFSVTGKRLRIVDLAKAAPLYPDLVFDQQLVSGQFSDDGKNILVTESSSGNHSNGTIRIFDAESGKSVILPLAVPILWNAIFSPGGKTFAVASGEGWARIYDTFTGQPTTGPMAHSGAVIQIAFSFDGKQLATGSADNTARVWDTATGKAITAPMKHEESPWALGFSRDGSRLASIGNDKALRIWDARSGYLVSPALRQIGEFQDGIFPVGATNQFIIVTQSGAAWWDFTRAVDPGTIRFDHSSEATRTAVSPDGSRIAVNSSKGTVRLLDVESGKLVCVLPHPADVGVLHFSHDSQRLITVSKDTARIWDISPAGMQPTTSPSTPPTGRLVATIKHDGVINTASFSANGAWVVTASADKTARVWDATTGQPVSEPMVHDGDVTDAEFNSDGTLLATSSADHSSRVWDATTGKPKSDVLKSISSVPMVRFSPDGKSLVSPDDGGYVRIWDWQTGQCTSRMLYGTATREASFTNDGSQILTAGFNTGAKLFDIKTPRAPSVVYAGGSFCAIGRLNPAGTIVYTAGFAGSRLWDIGGSPLGPAIQPLPMRDGQFTPDGRRLITVDTRIRAWDITPDERPVADLEKFARLIAGRTLDAKGVISPITDDTALKLFTELREKYPADFADR